MNISSPKLPFLFAAALLTGLTCFALRSQAAQPKPGEAFPALTDFVLEGQLPELKGKIVLMDFWASWCTPCKASFPALNELQERFGKQGVVILGINVDEKRSDMEAFLKKTPARFAVVRDAQQKLVAKASVETMPTSFLLDREGNVRFVHSGFHGAVTIKQYEKELGSLLNQAKP